MGGLFGDVVGHQGTWWAARTGHGRRLSVSRRLRRTLYFTVRRAQTHVQIVVRRCFARDSGCARFSGCSGGAQLAALPRCQVNRLR